MSDGVIFLVQADGSLVRMTETPYDSEDLLQRLLAQYPDILAGEQIDKEHPRRWLLISREYGVPAENDGSDRWSIDHLFVDQDGVPTLVEVKRSTDTRIRREVLGQVLDYAANAVLHWPVATIISKFEQRFVDADLAARTLEDFIGEKDADWLWSEVKTNLEAGRIRLVFVADEIPDELRTVIDFLAKQMDPATVFGIEVKQYVGALPHAGGQTLRNLVPRLVAGRLPAPKTAGPRGRWTPERFFAELQSAHPETVPVARRLVELGVKLTGRAMEHGTGMDRGSLTARMRLNGLPVGLFSLYTTGGLSINIGWTTRLSELGEDLSEGYRRLAEQAGFPVDPQGWGRGWNMFPLKDVEQKFDSFSRFISNVAGDLRERSEAKAKEQS